MHAAVQQGCQVLALAYLLTLPFPCPFSDHCQCSPLPPLLWYPPHSIRSRARWTPGGTQWGRGVQLGSHRRPWREPKGVAVLGSGEDGPSASDSCSEESDAEPEAGRGMMWQQRGKCGWEVGLLSAPRKLRLTQAEHALVMWNQGPRGYRRLPSSFCVPTATQPAPLSPLWPSVVPLCILHYHLGYWYTLRANKARRTTCRSMLLTTLPPKGMVRIPKLIGMEAAWLGVVYGPSRVA
jgi:hypothetical protein